MEDVDFTEQVKRIYFRFKKSKDNHVEWIDFGSNRICSFKSKTARKVPKTQKAEPNAAAASNATIVLNGNKTMKLDAPPSMNSDSDLNLKPNDNTMSSNIPEVDTNSHMSQSCDPYANHDSNSVPTPRSPDFVTPLNVLSFTLDNNRSTQPQPHGSSELAVTETVGSQPPVAASPTAQSSTLYRSGGSIPAGWSGLDILAAVTFDAAPTTATTTSVPITDPTLPVSAFATLSNVTHATGPMSSTHGWGMDNMNHNNTNSMSQGNPIGSYSNGNHHESSTSWQNQHRCMPMWPQQQQQPHQPAQRLDQRWFPTFDNVRMSQPHPLPTASMNSMYDRMNHNNMLSQEPQSLTQQQRQQWHNTATFNGDASSSHIIHGNGTTSSSSSNNGNNIAAANPYYSSR